MIEENQKAPQVRRLFAFSSIVFALDLNDEFAVALDADDKQIRPTTHLTIFGEFLSARGRSVHENLIFFAAELAIVGLKLVEYQSKWELTYKN